MRGLNWGINTHRTQQRWSIGLGHRHKPYNSSARENPVYSKSTSHDPRIRIEDQHNTHQTSTPMQSSKTSKRDRASIGNQETQTSPRREDRHYVGPSAAMLLQHHPPHNRVKPLETGPLEGCLVVATTITQCTGASRLLLLDLTLVASDSPHAGSSPCPPQYTRPPFHSFCCRQSGEQGCPTSPALSMPSRRLQADLIFLLHPCT